MTAQPSGPLRSVRLALPAGGAREPERLAFAVAVFAICLGRYLNRARLVLGADSAAVDVVLRDEPFAELLGAVRTGIAGRREPGTLDALVRNENTPPGSSANAELSLASDGTTATVSLRGGKFDANEAGWLRDHLAHIAEQAAADPGRSVVELGALPPDVARMIVTEWNGSRRPEPEPRCLHRIVEQQALDRPDAPALHEGASTLTYAQLNARANQLALHLMDAHAVRSGDRVAILLPRGIDQVVAILAVLKTGSAYVPLDPAHPADRREFILTDTASSLLLTRTEFAPETDTPVLALDQVGLDRLPTGDPGGAAFAESVACVVYTSGTTGRPKGVLLTHRGLCNSVRWEHRAYRLRPQDRMLHLAASTFSLAIVELFGPLCAGAQVVIAPGEASRDSKWITRLVVEHGVTLLSVVPSELKLLLDHESGLPWTALRAVITGADVLPVPVQNQLLTTCPSVALFNIYGQTESSVDGTAWICERRQGQTTVPVGRPITNTTMYVLDEALRPVPVGVPGELYTGGVALAHGYLGLPGLTAAKFVPNPFAESVRDSRLYRSGDIARWLPGGVLELLGRHDRQIQLRGIRIELEEIEAVLREHPDVRDAVVTTHEAPAAVAVPRDRAAWAALLAEFDEAIVLRALDQVESAIV